MASTQELLFHMRTVQAAERDMRELGLVWQTIESAAAISCPAEVATILPTLSRTRERFGGLQARLVESLAEESRAELGDELAARARCSIDILVRNLYERTADVGFLSGDDAIRAFCAADEATRDATRAALRARLAAYRAKYTVYEDVVVLGTDGTVLARLAEAGGPVRTTEPALAAALARDGYVERFGRSDLAPSDAPALLYAHRVVDATGRAIGVLVLSFRFEDELRRIFAAMSDARGQTALVLIDEGRRVIASSDPAHVATGIVLSEVAPDEVVATTFAGREYLAVCCGTRGYQGYGGPPWRVRAMVSLLVAFRARDDADEPADGAEVPLDNARLGEIQRDADEINRELRRVVWNGQLMARSRDGDRERLKAVLREINTVGHRTRARVGLAIRELYRTAMARGRQQSSDLARLAADIMDRNLYERANDCRWWALSPAIADGLAGPADDATAASLGGVLDRLNALYTVYGRIAAFDADGRVRGVSRAQAAPGLVGRAVPPAWLEAVRRLGDPQRYAVSAFEPTDFHDAGETYVYLAAVRDRDGGTMLGGVALVFDARAELGAMLRDVLGERHGFAAFVDASGRVVAATDAAAAAEVGARLAGGGGIVEQGGANYAVAFARATGYREFKVDDGYDNGVRALVGLRLGPVDRRRRTLAEEALAVVPVHGEGQAELAVFQVGAGRYALRAERLLQAVPRQGIRRIPTGLRHAVGVVEVDTPDGVRAVQVMCARGLFGVEPGGREGDGVVLVLGAAGDPTRPSIALRVDDVLSVLEVDSARIQDAPPSVRGPQDCIRGLVECDLVVPAGSPPRRVLVQVVDVDALVDASTGSRRSVAVGLPERADEAA